MKQRKYWYFKNSYTIHHSYKTLFSQFFNVPASARQPSVSSSVTLGSYLGGSSVDANRSRGVIHASQICGLGACTNINTQILIKITSHQTIVPGEMFLHWE